jgi:hypothetical protein
MADKIGLRRAWIQYPGTWKEHYDVTMTKRAAAVRAGAIEIDLHQAHEQHNRKREQLASQAQADRETERSET